MPLHPEARRIIDRIAVLPADAPPMDAAAMREEFRKTWTLPADLPPVGHVEDTTFPGPAGEVPVRVYTPEGPSRGVFVWFHGGGWTIGSLDENEVACRTVCAGARTTVVSVDYRLAPENPYPAAAEDCYAATQWAATHHTPPPTSPSNGPPPDGSPPSGSVPSGEMVGGPPSDGSAPSGSLPSGEGVGNSASGGSPPTGAIPSGEGVSGLGGGVVVGGESAGGNLAAVVALMARDRGGPEIALQVLISPVLGHPDDGRESYREFAEGYFLSRASMEWFFTTYPRDDSDLDDPYLLPLRAEDLKDLPPALILGAEYDVLRDEGEDYARALRRSGVRVEVERLDGLIHGFFGLLARELSASRDAHARVVEALRAAFGDA